MLRSTVALANVYYDFGLDGGVSGYSGGGGAFGYVGAGAGVAWNHVETNSPVGVPIPVPTGTNVSGAAAVMVGVGYDMGTWVADLGYRGLYINQISNAPTDPRHRARSRSTTTGSTRCAARSVTVSTKRVHDSRPDDTRFKAAAPRRVPFAFATRDRRD